MTRAYVAVVLVLFCLLACDVGADTAHVTQPADFTITVTDLGTYRGAPTDGWDISNSGEIVGHAGPLLGEHVAFYWSDRTGFVEILRAEAYAIALEINSRGQVIGHYTRIEPDGVTTTTQGFLWDRNSRVLKDLGHFLPVAINDHGVIVGSTAHSDKAYVYEAGTLREIRVADDVTFLYATGINNRGVVVGVFWSPSVSAYRGFTWSEQTGLAIIEPPPGMSDSLPGKINNSGLVCGVVLVDSFNSFIYAAMWKDGVLQSIDTSVHVDGAAYDINDRGWCIRDRQLWIDEAGPIVLPPPPGTFGSAVMGLNNGGQVVGFARRPTGPNSGTLTLAVWTVRPNH